LLSSKFNLYRSYAMDSLDALMEQKYLDELSDSDEEVPHNSGAVQVESSGPIHSFESRLVSTLELVK
jgi:hypothetical protein